MIVGKGRNSYFGSFIPIKIPILKVAKRARGETHAATPDIYIGPLNICG